MGLQYPPLTFSW